MSEDADDLLGPEIEITEAMIAAGIVALEWCLDQEVSKRFQVRAVYRAMLLKDNRAWESPPQAIETCD